MTRHDIPWLSAAETAVAIKTKQVSPVEVVQAYLARIERFDGPDPVARRVARWPHQAGPPGERALCNRYPVHARGSGPD